MQQQQSPSKSTIKTIHMKGVPYNENQRKKCGICSFVPRVLCEILLVLLIFVPLLLFPLIWPSVKEFIHGKALSNTRLAPMSDGFNIWSNPPVKTVRAYRLFNITNHIDIMSKTNSPTIEYQETEPLTYQVSIKKNNVQWFEDDKKIQYSLERFFMRQGEFTERLLNQAGAFVDIPRAMFRTKFERIADSVFYILGGHSAFDYSKAVDKLEGYVSPIFAAISARMQGPNKDRYGFIYRYNGSNGFNFTIHTGIENSSIKGQVVDFASEYTPFKTQADQWQATFFDGLTYPPLGNPTNRKVINVFQPDFCRPIQLRYNRTVSMFGLPNVLEYVLKLVDAEKCPEMDENCPEVDKLDITKCFSAEIPEETIFLSKPHMYGHNSSLLNIAFAPDMDKHESRVYFEPITGTPVQAQSRIQLNINAWIDRVTVDVDGSLLPTNTRAVRRFLPMMWIDQTVTLNDDILGRLKLLNNILQNGHHVHQSFKLVYAIVALLCVVALIIVIESLVWNRQRKSSRKSFYRSNNEQEKALLNQTLTMSPTTA